MSLYVLKRLLLMIPTLFGIMLVSFVVTQFVPGGPVEQMVSQLRGSSSAGEAAGGQVSGGYRGQQGLDAQILADLRRFYGFDKPAAQRFVEMLWRYVRLDLGESFFFHRSVTQLILDKLPVSMSLGLWSFFLTYLICIPLGIAKAVRDGSRFDVITSTVVLVGYAIPGFVLAVALLVLFGGGSFWDLFPLRGLVSDHWETLSWPARIADYLWHMALPIIALMVGNLAVMTLLTKNSFIEEMRKQYVLTARAKGISENRVLYRHLARNAMIPLVTGFPGQFVAAFFTGSLLIEQIFSLDGLGLLGYQAILHRDYPVVLGTLFAFSILGLLAKLLTDLAYVLVDPRIQFEAIRS